MQARDVWSRASRELALQMTKSTYDSHVRDVRPLEGDAEIAAGSQVVLLAASESSRQWLEMRLMHVVGRAIGDVVGGVVSLRVVAPERLSPHPVRQHTGSEITQIAADSDSKASTEVAQLEAECKKTVQVVDRRRGYSMVEHVVVDEYLPIMGPTVFAVYALYCRLSGNREGRAFPGFRAVCAHLHIGPATLAEANTVLELLGLIEVERGDAANTNRYALLDVGGLDPDTRLALQSVAVEKLPDNPTRRRVLEALAAGSPTWGGRARGRPPGGPGPVASRTGKSASVQKRGDSVQKQGASQPEAEQQQTCLLLESEKTVVVEDVVGSHGGQPVQVESDASVDELLDEVVALGVERRTALSVLATNTLYRVCGWLDYTVAQKNLKNPAGFFLSRIGSGDEPP